MQKYQLVKNSNSNNSKEFMKSDYYSTHVLFYPYWPTPNTNRQSDFHNHRSPFDLVKMVRKWFSIRWKAKGIMTNHTNPLQLIGEKSHWLMVDEKRSSLGIEGHVPYYNHLWRPSYMATFYMKPHLHIHPAITVCLLQPWCKEPWSGKLQRRSGSYRQTVTSFLTSMFEQREGVEDECGGLRFLTDCLEARLRGSCGRSRLEMSHTRRQI